MSEYRFIYNQFSCIDNGSIFHSKTFFDLHKALQESFYFEYLKKDKVIASIQFFESSDNLWRSPIRGTFSGLSLDVDVQMSEIINFICLIEDFLRSRSAKTLEILVAPLVYNSALTSVQIYSLYSLGFTFSNCDLNYTLKINSEKTW